MVAYTQLVYCSRSTAHGPDASRSAIRDILETSRLKNPQHEVTGVLLATGDWFAQVLEGPTEGVDRIFEAVRFDGRHHDLVVMPRRDVNERSFKDWSMAFATTDDDTDHATAVLERAAARPDSAAVQTILQFQDIARQEIEHAVGGLDNLEEYARLLSVHAYGDVPIEQVDDGLTTLDQIFDHYVMDRQRRVHHEATCSHAAESVEAPAIELF